MPSAALQWQFQKDSNLRVVYSRGLARPNIGDLVPATTKDQNQIPYPTVATGNPKLVPTKSDSFDILVEHYFQPLGILQAGCFYEHLADPIYPVANLAYYNGTTFCSQGTPGCQQWQVECKYRPGQRSNPGVARSSRRRSEEVRVYASLRAQHSV